MNGGGGGWIGEMVRKGLEMWWDAMRVAPGFF